jgi:hypothetical protein
LARAEWFSFIFAFADNNPLDPITVHMHSGVNA